MKKYPHQETEAGHSSNGRNGSQANGDDQLIEMKNH
jgi:hypothetical protein